MLDIENEFKELDDILKEVDDVSQANYEYDYDDDNGYHLYAPTD